MTAAHFKTKHISQSFNTTSRSTVASHKKLTSAPFTFTPYLLKIRMSWSDTGKWHQSLGVGSRCAPRMLITWLNVDWLSQPLGLVILTHPFSVNLHISFSFFIVTELLRWRTLNYENMLLTVVSLVVFVSSGMLTLQLGFRNAAIRFFCEETGTCMRLSRSWSMCHGELIQNEKISFLP